MTSIHVKIANTKGKTLIIEILSTKTLLDLKKECCKQLNLDYTQYQFKFDGDVIEENFEKDSLDDHQIGDYDMITLNERQLGGKDFIVKLNKKRQ